MPAFPLQGLTSLKLVLQAAPETRSGEWLDDALREAQVTAPALMALLTNRREGPRLKALVTDLLVTSDEVIKYATQQPPSLVVPQELVAYVVYRAALTTSIDTVSSRACNRHFPHNDDVVRLVGTKGFYSGSKRSGCIGVDLVSTLLEPLHGSVSKLCDAALHAHSTLSSVQPHHPQVLAVLNALEACGWRDLPVGDDAVKKFLKKDAAWVLGPPGAAGRRFLFALSGEEHCCWVRRGVSPSTQLNNRSDVVTYECHRRRKQTRRAPDSSTVHGDDDDDEGFERRHLPHLLQL